MQLPKTSYWERKHWTASRCRWRDKQGLLKKIDNIGGGRNTIDFLQPIQSRFILIDLTSLTRRTTVDFPFFTVVTLCRRAFFFDIYYRDDGKFIGLLGFVWKLDNFWSVLNECLIILLINFKINMCLGIFISFRR